jgi:predicted HicB family RNase H-like nuclease
MNSMSYNGYTARMEFDADDKIIVGRVIDIDDIITFHGESVAEFEAAFKTAVDGYIQACEQLGQAAEKPASGRLMLRVSPLVHAAAVKASARSGQSLNKWAEKVLGQAAHA